jgi:hypothetical protein
MRLTLNNPPYIPKPEENEPVISNVLKVKKLVNNKSIEDSL